MKPDEKKTPPTAWALLEASTLHPIDCLQKLHALTSLAMQHDPDQEPDACELIHVLEIMADLLHRLDSGLCELQDVMVAAAA